MKSLELKIPPLILLILFMIFAWFLRHPSSPEFAITGVNLAAVCIFIVSLIVINLGVLGFQRQKTTVDPRYPEQASSLVVKGIYCYTRNPMYLGFALLLLSWSLMLHSFWSGLLVPVFIVYLNQFQIKPEERYLEQKFQQDYLDYKARVRRWI